MYLPYGPVGEIASHITLVNTCLVYGLTSTTWKGRFRYE